MMRRSIFRTSIAVLAAGFMLACASTPDPEEEGQTDIGGSSSWNDPGGGISGEPGGSGGPGGTAGGGAAAGAVVGTQDAATQRLQDALDAIYFDYDRSTLRPDAVSTLKNHADSIRDFPTWALVTIEGHCDERGSEEYNLALGDRRADAVKRYLVTLGIPGDRIRTVSYGELKPSVQGHDEGAWRYNRRAEFLVSR